MVHFTRSKYHRSFLPNCNFSIFPLKSFAHFPLSKVTEIRAFGVDAFKSGIKSMPSSHIFSCVTLLS